MNFNPNRLLTFLILFVSMMTAVPPEVSAGGKAKPQVIKLQRYRKALWTMNVTVKGKTGDFLFDTGGGVTLLGEDFAKDIDCKFWGRSTGYNMFGKRGDGQFCESVQLAAGGVPLTPANVGKINFGDMFPGSKAPDGLLSLDAFDGKAITIDQQAATVTIETPESLASRTKRMTELPFRISRECSGRCFSVFVGVPVSDGMTWLTLDSGAGGVSIISKEYAPYFGLDPEAKGQQLKFNIGSGITVDSPAMVTDMIMDGNLGQPFISQYVITMDLARGRVWFAKPAGS
jgi:hypothetical protein